MKYWKGREHNPNKWPFKIVKNTCKYKCGTIYKPMVVTAALPLALNSN